jgi:hypothetical protein
MFSKVLFNLIKYALEGTAIAVAASIVSKGKLSGLKTVTLAITAALVFLILDMYAPLTGRSTRQGTGFGLGFSMINSPLVGGEPDMCGGNQSGGTCSMTGGNQCGGTCSMCGGEGGQDGGECATCRDSTLLDALKGQVGGNQIKNELRTGQYGVSVIPSFNEYAEAYNASDLHNLSHL